MTKYIGTIQIFAINFIPRGWAACEGQLIPIGANPALYAVIGCKYGGDAVNNFALPDLRQTAIVSDVTTDEPGHQLTYSICIAGIWPTQQQSLSIKKQ